MKKAPKHQPRGGTRAQLNRKRKQTDPFLKRAAWLKARRIFLGAHPTCCDPYGVHDAVGQVVLATDVDHVVPRSLNPRRALDPTNMQALCHECHSKKTRREQLERATEATNAP